MEVGEEDGFVAERQFRNLKTECFLLGVRARVFKSTTDRNTCLMMTQKLRSGLQLDWSCVVLFLYPNRGLGNGFYISDYSTQ